MLYPSTHQVMFKVRVILKTRHSNQFNQVVTDSLLKNQSASQQVKFHITTRLRLDQRASHSYCPIKAELLIIQSIGCSKKLTILCQSMMDFLEVENQLWNQFLTASWKKDKKYGIINWMVMPNLRQLHSKS